MLQHGWTTALFATGLGLILSISHDARAQLAPPSTAAKALAQEIARAKKLELPDMPRPHHVVATLYGQEESVVEARLGSIVSSDRGHARMVKVEVRVGDPSFDSSNFFGSAEEPVVAGQASLEDDSEALRRVVWLLTDRAYKNATETFEAKRAHVESMASAQEDELPDFSAAPVIQFRDPSRTKLPPPETYAPLARAASAVFSNHPNIQLSYVRVVARARTRTFVDSAGTMVEDASNLLQVVIAARTQADDGMVLTDYETLATRDVKVLPPIEELTKKAVELAARLEIARVAPIVDDYAGPVLFEGQAAAQLLRYLLADELSATPPPEPGMGAAASTLSSRVGWRVLPLGFEVVDDPTVSTHAGFSLIGDYRFDDEGVRAERVNVVQDGTLRSLLASRTPSKTQGTTNGHGRAGLTGHARGRVGNLLIATQGGLSAGALRGRLLAAARKEGVNYGIVVTCLDEPALTEQALHAAARGAESTELPRPTQMYRIRAGAKPELVRGASLQALRPRDLRHIAAASQELFPYSYMASSSPIRSPGSFGGDIPTTIVSPSLLLPDVDITQPTTPHPLPPIVPKPAPPAAQGDLEDR